MIRSTSSFASGALNAPIDCATSGDVLAVPGGGGDRVGVLLQARVGVAGGELDGDRVVEQGRDEVPVPGFAAGAGNENVGHAG